MLKDRTIKTILAIIIITVFAGVSIHILNTEKLDIATKVAPEKGSEITGLTEEEQKNVYDENVAAYDAGRAKGTYVVSEDLGVYMPTKDWNKNMDANDEAYYLSNYALTYPDYGSPGEGNFIVFAHNSGTYNQGYFTPFVDNLQVGNEVIVKDDGKTYKYKITNKRHVDADDNDAVYYQSPDKAIITIGTCDAPVSGATGRYIWTGELVS